MYDLLSYYISTSNISNVNNILNNNTISINQLNEFLLQAVIANNIFIIKLLDDKGADLKHTNCKCIKTAIRLGHIGVFIYMYDKNAYNNRYEILFIAASVGKLQIIIHIEDNINVNAGNDMAMRYACEYGHKHIVKYIHKKHYGDIHIKEDWCIRKAAQNNHLHIIKYLHKHGCNICRFNNYVLLHACKYGYLDIVKYVIHICMVPICVDNYMPFMEAVKYNHLKIIEYFVDNYNLDVKINNNFAIKWAHKYNNNELIVYLSKFYTLTDLYNINLIHNKHYHQRLIQASAWIKCYNSTTLYKIPLDIYTYIINFI